MSEALVYLSITNGKNRLVISGSYEIFQNFVTTFTQDAPRGEPITRAPRVAGDEVFKPTLAEVSA